MWNPLRKPAAAPTISPVADEQKEFFRHLAQVKASIPTMKDRWYPYGSAGNFHCLNETIPGGWETVQKSLIGTRIADIGAADGDTAFYLEHFGIDVDIIDHGPTNFNGLTGARSLKAALGSSVGVYDIDLDSQFQIPAHYEFVMFLGILYHLKNPFYALESLAKSSRRMVLSTRVFSHDKIGGTEMRDAPLAYLVGPQECNNDATNYWMFSRAGLLRILERTGWDIKALKMFGATEASDPYSQENDERAFVYAESRA